MYLSYPSHPPIYLPTYLPTGVSVVVARALLAVLDSLGGPTSSTLPVRVSGVRDIGWKTIRLGKVALAPAARARTVRVTVGLRVFEPPTLT